MPGEQPGTAAIIFWFNLIKKDTIAAESTTMIWF